MKNVFKVFCEVYKTDKKEFFGGIVFIILWAAILYVALVIGSLE